MVFQLLNVFSTAMLTFFHIILKRRLKGRTQFVSHLKTHLSFLGKCFFG